MAFDYERIFFLKEFIALWCIVIPRSSCVLQRLDRSIQKKKHFNLDAAVKPLKDAGRKQNNGGKWKVVLLMMIEVSFAFVLVSCGARGPLYLPKNIYANQQVDTK